MKSPILHGLWRFQLTRLPLVWLLFSACAGPASGQWGTNQVTPPAGQDPPAPEQVVPKSPIALPPAKGDGMSAEIMRLEEQLRLLEQDLRQDRETHRLAVAALKWDVSGLKAAPPPGPDPAILARLEWIEAELDKRTPETVVLERISSAQAELKALRDSIDANQAAIARINSALLFLFFVVLVFGGVWIWNLVRGYLSRGGNPRRSVAGVGGGTPNRTATASAVQTNESSAAGKTRAGLGQPRDLSPIGESVPVDASRTKSASSSETDTPHAPGAEDPEMRY